MSFASEIADMPPKQLTAGFTGHRPKSLPWQYNERDPRCAALKAELSLEIERAYAEGKRYFVSGMAEGVDLYAAEAVLEFKRLHEDVSLIAVFPYGAGNSARQRRAAGRADRVISLFEQYSAGCMLARDRFLAKSCSRMICVFSGNTKSGTAATMRMALEEGVSLTVIRV